MSGTAFAIIAKLTFVSLASSAAVIPVKMKPPEIKFLSLSVASVEPVETLLGSGSVHLKSGVHNAKLSVVFDRPLALRKVQIESCGDDWTDGIEVFTSPGNGRVFIEGGRKSLLAKLKTSGDVESVAIVFGHNADLCLKGLKFLSDDDQSIPLVAPATTKVKVVGSGGDRLFDSHPETQTALEDQVRLIFDESKTFDRAFIWTGGTALYAHSLKLKGEKGWTETLPLRNSVSEQEVIFKKPFTGKELTIQAPDAGEIGEVRFGYQTKVQAFSADAAPETTRDELHKKFALAGFEKLLDAAWMTTEDDKWTFLFRSDGTFFVHGFNDDSRAARDYSAVGAFTLVRQESGRLRLSINGVRFATGLGWDGVNCPFACGNEEVNETSTSVFDSLVLEKAGKGSDQIMVRNRTPRARRTMTFGDLRIRQSVD